VLVLVLLGLITASGLAILQQGQVAITYINEFINTLPDTIAQMSHQSYSLGPFSFDFSRLDLAAVVQQGLDLVRPLLGEAGNLLGAIASGTVNTFGWGLFILLVSYFLLSESGRVQEDLVHIEIPGYTEDIRRLVRQLIGTWYAFLRGQATISLLIVVAYYILLTLLGTRLALVIALVAGIAAFIPYAGPAIAWTVTGIIAYLQVDNYFGLAPFFYAVLVVACCLVLNQIFDNLVWPRIMGSSLGLHPAGVLIAAIVATDLLGFVGLMLAAPVLATMAVLTRYVGRKMLDLDPWAPEPEKQRPAAPRWLSWWRRRSAVEGGSGERFRPSSG
ncbi:MAG: AI-2E family transporter, partial [Chloroflexota bacterium]